MNTELGLSFMYGAVQPAYMPTDLANQRSIAVKMSFSSQALPDLNPEEHALSKVAFRQFDQDGESTSSLSLTPADTSKESHAIMCPCSPRQRSHLRQGASGRDASHGFEPER